MNILKIQGGVPLCGEIDVHGSKNSVLPILAATLIHSGESVIHNCPDLRDVRFAVAILEYLGCKVKREESTVTVDSSTVSRCDIPDHLMREMRSSVIFLGAVIARCARAHMSFPGGCELGPRPIDLHMAALKKMGVEIRDEGGKISCRARRLRGCDINLAFPSVGATENIMLAAVACPGKTRILNAAREPEIEDLQEFLRAVGVKVSGAGSSTVEIDGECKTHDCEHNVIPDRIVAATYLTAVAAAGGDALINKMRPEHISTVISQLEYTGCDLDVGADSVRIKRDSYLHALPAVRTMPYPGFPTDAQAPMMAFATQCKGISMFVENIFDSRYRHVSELIRMGADIRVEGKIALVTGCTELTGACVAAPDLRGGAALVVAALAAHGESRIGEIWHIDRGYEKLEDSLSRLGAQITRIKNNSDRID